MIVRSQPFVYNTTKPLCSHTYVMPTVLKLVKHLPPGARVLDVGCGNGALLSCCAGRGWDLYGVDLSESAISVARQAYPEIAFSVADITDELRDLFPACHFDNIVSTEVIEHLYDPIQFIVNCHHLLKPGGKLVVSTPYHGYIKNVALAVSDKLDNHFTALRVGGHIKFWSRRTLTKALEGAQFQNISFHGVGRAPLLWKSMIMSATKS